MTTIGAASYTNSTGLLIIQPFQFSASAALRRATHIQSGFYISPKQLASLNVTYMYYLVMSESLFFQKDISTADDATSRKNILFFPNCYMTSLILVDNTNYTIDANVPVTLFFKPSDVSIYLYIYVLA